MAQNSNQKPKSCINHPEKVPLVILRSEYLEITNGNHCAAKLLSIFEFWTNKLNHSMNSTREWIYKSLISLHSELFQEHGIHIIRRALQLLVDMGFLSRRHNPHIKYDRTWQYKLEVQKVQEALQSLICPAEQIESANELDPIAQNELSIAQKCTSITIEEIEEIKETDIEQAIEVVEVVEVVEITTEAVKQPAKQEIKEVCDELKRLRINPDPCLGVIKKYWENVAGAIAKVKEAMQEGWCNNPTGLFINSCKSGAVPKNALTSDVKTWFEWARRERIVLAMSGEVVYTTEGEAIALAEMMNKYPMQK